MKNNQLLIAVVAVIFLIAGVFYFGSKPDESTMSLAVDKAMAAKFEELSMNGNSSCSAEFAQAVEDGTTGFDRIQGSCCTPMDLHTYSEQVEGLKKYADIPEIPPDPYDIAATDAQMLMSYYDKPLTLEQQAAYDYAMANSMGKGPCCCKCWGWYVYGGLAKKLIIERGFTGEQVTDVWNLSDMCGGPGAHINHT